MWVPLLKVLYTLLLLVLPKKPIALEADNAKWRKDGTSSIGWYLAT